MKEFFADFFFLLFAGSIFVYSCPNTTTFDHDCRERNHRPVKRFGSSSSKEAAMATDRCQGWVRGTWQRVEMKASLDDKWIRRCMWFISHRILPFLYDNKRTHFRLGRAAKARWPSMMSLRANPEWAGAITSSFFTWVKLFGRSL